MIYPIARYRFEFKVTQAIQCQDYAGSMLRGAFGLALRQRGCTTGLKDCADCPQYRQCPYMQIFESPAPANHELQKFSHIPNPYIIEAPPWGEKCYQLGDILAFEMVLIGEALQQLPLIIACWQQAFAKLVGTGRGELHQVTLLQPNHGDLAAQAVWQAGRLDEHATGLRFPLRERGNVRLIFLTPLRLLDNGRALKPGEITTESFFMYLARRCSLMAELQMGQDLQLNFAQIKATAQALRNEQHLHWQPWARYSNRQKQKIPLAGAVGEWVFYDVSPSLLFLLELGEWLHVGKNATLGLGKYVLLNEY